MSKIIKWIAFPAFALCLALVADTPTAEAGGGLIRIGGLQIGFGNGGGYHSGFRGGYGGGIGNGYGYAPQYGGSHHSYHSGHHGNVGGSGFGYNSGYGRYHNTSHWDYHPTQVVPHGNHLDVIPGHYDYHRTGHFHH